MRERTSKEYISIPHIERPAIKLHIKHVETLRKRHRVTYAAAHEALGSMDTRVPQHGERRNEKLHVVVAVKLKGVSQVYIAENNTRHHAERELAQILLYN